MAVTIGIKVLPELYGLARLDPTDAIPSWADGPGFVTISRSDDELSILCRQDRIPAQIQSDLGWTCLKFLGPFAFGQTGIVLSVVRPLSENGIGVFVVSTFDGDHLMVSERDAKRSLELLRMAGHHVVP